MPFRLLQGELLSLNPVTPELLAETLNRFETVVLITKSENARLNAMKLGNRMPEGWDGKDPLARYKAAGIELVPNGPGV